ncbi:MAG: PAS domain S-box protein [Candidatus Melainabacteria bacterium]|nr:PAS domain S-box protein [Candidatus Melainabacteria bacterium]
MLIFELVLMLLAGAMIFYTDDVVRKERKATETVAQINRLFSLIQRASSGLIEQIHDLHDPNSKAFYETYGVFLKTLPEELQKLKTLTDDNAELRFSVSEIEHNLLEGRDMMERVRIAFSRHEWHRDHLLFELNDISHLANRQIESLLKNCEVLQRRHLEESMQTRRALTIVLGIIAVLNIIGMVALVLGFAREVAKRLAVVRDNSLRFAAGVPLTAPQRSTDEIGDLDRAVHQMADVVQDAMRRERAVLENASNMICSITPDLTFASCNPASLKILNYADDELLGKRFIEIIAEEDKVRTRDSFEEAMKSRAHAEVENKLVRKGGGVIDASWSVKWSESDRALFCVVHDITHRKEVERLKRAFLQMVSHDLRSPLTSIQASVDMVSNGMYGELPERSKQALSQVNSNIGRLIALVNGLLSLEKMESGHLQLDCSMIKASAVVDPSVHSIQGMAQKHRIKLAVVNEGDPIFYGDQDRLVQVLVNLLSNAIKFSPEKTTVTIAVEEGDDFVEVQVNDQGKGIPEDKREFVFERFKQVDREDETKKGGIGLGLPICKAIVEQHNGAIGVGTADGGGCRMWFRIPKAAAAL